jgi:hypothetical protein
MADVESFTCPRCGITSWNPNDVREGYCGACHAWTGVLAGALTPDCPLCGHPPVMVFGTQAFCGNDACTLLLWSPALTLDENLMDAGFVRLPGEEGR